MPTGLTLSSAGGLSGTPTTEGDFAFTILATDSLDAPGNASTRRHQMPEHHREAFLAPGREPWAVLTTRTFVAHRRQQLRPPSSVENGTLPNGLTLSSDGILSGTPTTEGSLYVHHPGDRPLRLHRKTAVHRRHQMPNDHVKSITGYPTGEWANHTTGPLSRAAAISPYSFTVVTGSLPDGLTLSSGGVLSGTPTAAGTFTFTIVAKDSFGCDGKRHTRLSCVTDITTRHRTAWH